MSKVTRRLIGEDDLEAVADVLSKGFPTRSRQGWHAGLLRQSARACPPDAPRFGALLESDGQIVGVVLSFFAAPTQDGDHQRCNFSSWYVAPGFEAYSLMLTNFLLRDRTTIFFNLSAAPHTRAIIEAQGFAPYDAGWFLTAPALRLAQRRLMRHRFAMLKHLSLLKILDWSKSARADVALGRPKARVKSWPDDAAAIGLSDDERRLLSDHHAMGCLCFVVRSQGVPYPFVFSPRRYLKRLIATCFLAYCRDIADYQMFAGPLGRALLRRGIATVLLDQRCQAMLGPGQLISRQTIKYFHGPQPPRPGDISYSELVVFDA